MEHRVVTPEELIAKTKEELPRCKGVTLFKLEPFVLHVGTGVECEEKV